MECIDSDGKEISIRECKSKDNRFMMITRWELGKNHSGKYGWRYLHIDYHGTEEQFEKGRSAANLTSEMKDMLCTLPQSITTLTNLIVLSVLGDGPNKISLSTLPDSIGNLTNLRVLELSKNELTTLPNSIGNLKNLEELDLSFNKCRSLPNSIGNLTNLRVLKLFKNELTTLPNSIGNLKNLEELILFENYSFSKLPDSIGNLKKLGILDLAETKLESLPKSMENLTNLYNLYLGTTEMTWNNDKGLIKEEKKYPYSWYVKIIKQSLEHLLDISLDSFLEQCSSLDLSGKNLKQIPFGVFIIKDCIEAFQNETYNYRRIEILEELDISNNQLTEIPRLFRKLWNLKKLYIHDNPNLNHLPDFLWEMEELRILKIDGKLVRDLPENAIIKWEDKKWTKEDIIDLALASKSNVKMSDEALAKKLGPCTVYLE